VKRTAFLATIFASLLIASAAAHAGSSYPLIRILSQDDALFVQQQFALDDFRKLVETRGPVEFPPVDIFEYQKRSAEDLFSLNARLGMRYDSLATLNGSADADAFNGRNRILIPSQDGLFINNPPRGDLEALMLSTRLHDGRRPRELVITRDGKRDAVYFFPADSFTPMERSYFLGILFRLPIDSVRITSVYGWRSDPFTGKPEFHSGVDFGAQEGTGVRAARNGVVEEVGKNQVLGNFVVLTHPGGYQTVYGHLSTISVTMNQKVQTGELIAGVGHTGLATGPHLHFEVRTKAGTRDPLRLLAMKKG
jgi:murein DD-endopeptidase MepM/ murein hydrolase activator NlpD